VEITIIPKDPKYENLLKLFPPITSNKNLPNWYKNFPKSNELNTLINSVTPLDNANGAKSCPAIIDTLVAGITIPLWFDFAFKTIYKDGIATDQYWKASIAEAYGDPIEEHVGQHNIPQTYGLDIGRTLNNLTLKFHYPFKILAPKGYNIFFTDPFYQFRNNIRCLNGIVELDKHGVFEFPFSILKDEFLLKAGTPLIQALIYKRDEEKIKINVRNGTKEEYEEIKEDVFLNNLLNMSYKERFNLKNE